MVCQLGRDPAISGQCRPGECERCRWNPEEAARRERQLMTEGLTELEDGTRRLIIRGKSAPASAPNTKSKGSGVK